MERNFRKFIGRKISVGHEHCPTATIPKLTCVKALSHEAISLATCNANLGGKDISGSCRIVDICKLLYDLQSDYFAN